VAVYRATIGSVKWVSETMAIALVVLALYLHPYYAFGIALNVMILASAPKLASA
jgi:hypothetical protein